MKAALVVGILVLAVAVGGEWWFNSGREADTIARYEAALERNSQEIRNRSGRLIFYRTINQRPHVLDPQHYSDGEAAVVSRLYQQLLRDFPRHESEAQLILQSQPPRQFPLLQEAPEKLRDEDGNVRLGPRNTITFFEEFLAPPERR